MPSSVALSIVYHIEEWCVCGGGQDQNRIDATSTRKMQAVLDCKIEGSVCIYFLVVRWSVGVVLFLFYLSTHVCAVQVVCDFYNHVCQRKVQVVDEGII